MSIRGGRDAKSHVARAQADHAKKKEALKPLGAEKMKKTPFFWLTNPPPCAGNREQPCQTGQLSENKFGIPRGLPSSASEGFRLR